MRKIGCIIKQRRKLLRISQRQLADISGIGINTLTKIERGEANPSVGTLERVLDALGLKLDVSIKSIEV